jgi:hypothetical protein
MDTTNIGMTPRVSPFDPVQAREILEQRDTNPETGMSERTVQRAVERT